ncbi:cGMP-dependent protein kinase 2, partial [Reticulomyxa filosa]
KERSVRKEGGGVGVGEEPDMDNEEREKEKEGETGLVHELDVEELPLEKEGILSPSINFRKKESFYQSPVQRVESYHLRHVASKVYEKSSKTFKFLHRVLSRNLLFQDFNSKMIEKVVNWMYNYNKHEAWARSRNSKIYDCESSFGEKALLYGTDRTCTIEALDNCRMWVLDVTVFTQIKEKRAKKLRMLQSIPPFKNCSMAQLLQIYGKLRCFNYYQGDKITTEGESVTFFQIIVSGTAEGLRFDPKKCKEIVVKRFKPKRSTPSYFGDKEIEHNHTQQLTIKVTSHMLKCYALKASDFQRIVHELDKLDSAPNVATVEEDSYTLEESKTESSLGFKEDEIEKRLGIINNNNKVIPLPSTFVNRINCTLKDLTHLGVLGKGAFGVVSLVEDPTTGHTYSLKKIRKNQVVDVGQQKHIQNERRILSLLDHDFCVRLYATYQDNLHVYLLMESILGGELFYLLRYNRKFEEPVARFYACCVICAFEYIHSKKLIFRDLKPENLLLSSNGYCKLIDFGFAKQQDESCSLCGTAEYLAPETIQSLRQEATVDWWALGVFIYEMLFGMPPFRESAHIQIFEKILTSQAEFPRRSKVSSEAQDIVCCLLKKQPRKRLGTGPHGAKNVQKHPWFQ